MKVVYGHVQGIKSFPSMGECAVEIRVPIEHVGELTNLLFPTGPGRSAFVIAATEAPNGAKEGGYGVHWMPDEGAFGGLAGAQTGSSGGHQDTTSPNPSPNQGAKQPIGPRCLQACERCRDPVFWRFVAEAFDQPVNSEQTCARIVRAQCEVDSRREFDEDASGTAWSLWRANFAIPFERYLATRA